MNNYLRKIYLSLRRGPKYTIKKAIIQIDKINKKCKVCKFKKEFVKLDKELQLKFIANTNSKEEREVTKKIINSNSTLIFDSFVLRPNAFDNISADLQNHFIKMAENVLDKKILLFGKWVKFYDDEQCEYQYPWKYDFINGVSYPDTIYSSFQHVSQGGEIKIPWEFGRMQNCLLLAIAFRISKENRFLDEIRKIFLDFENNNPLGVGIQWSCTMEVGIRIFNILSAYVLVKSCLNADDELHFLIAFSAWKHGNYIFSHLETAAKLQENNHYLANLLGLACISCTFPFIIQSDKWMKYAKSETRRIMNIQILEDGTGFEASSRYSRLIGEMFYYIGRMYKNVGSNFEKKYWNRLISLASYLEWLTTNNGDSPQIGDNDSGRILIFSDRKYSDLRYLPVLIRYEANLKTDFKQAEEEILCIYGKQSILSCKKHLEGLKLFDNGGVGIFRNTSVYFVICATDSLKYDVPGHAHNDKLSFVLYYRDLPFFIDPGTGLYTGNAIIRNKLRGSDQHNTITIENSEQNRFESLFGYLYDGTSELMVESNNDEIIFSGFHNCYKKRYKTIHYRKCYISKHEFRIKVDDEFVPYNKNLNTKKNLVLHPDVKIEIQSNKKFVLKNRHITLILESNTEGKIVSGLYSPEYSIIEETNIIRFITQGSKGDSIQIYEK